MKIHSERDGSVGTIHRKISDISSRYNCSSEIAIKNVVDKFESTDSVHNTRRVIGEIEPQPCKNVIENLYKRIDVCKRSRGRHLSNIIFHP